MNIRLATLGDIEIISVMYRDFFAFHTDLQPAYYKKSEAGEYPINTIKSETADIIIAQDDENVAGFLHVLEDEPPPI